MTKKFVTTLAKQAGKILMKNFRQDFSLVSVRGSVKDVTTKYDKMVDRFIIREIRKKYPKHNLLTEETGAINKESEYTWIVDSLDGTVNYAYGNPLFSLCIALMKNGLIRMCPFALPKSEQREDEGRLFAYNDLLLGAIYAPAIDEFYWTEKGKGAYLNNKKIRVSQVQNLKKAYIFLCEGGDKNRARTGKIISRLYPKVTDLRKLGSAGLEAAWVAAGRAEAYVTTKIEPWDVAPGVLLVKEAGGEVTDFKGGQWKCQRSDLIFSNRKLHQTVQKLVKNL